MKKALIFTFVALALTAHLLATVLYLAPANPASKFYLDRVASYIEPVFTQNWGLFAPEPATVSLQFWYRCETNTNQITQWQDPIHQLFRYHHEFPFTYRGKLTYIYQSIARELLNASVRKSNEKKCKDAACAAEVEKEVRKDINYSLAVKFVGDLCYSQLGETLKSAEFQVMKVYPLDYSKRHLKDQSPKIETLKFSPVSFVKSQNHAMNREGN